MERRYEALEAQHAATVAQLALLEAERAAAQQQWDTNRHQADAACAELVRGIPPASRCFLSAPNRSFYLGDPAPVWWVGDLSSCSKRGSVCTCDERVALHNLTLPAHLGSLLLGVATRVYLVARKQLFRMKRTTDHGAGADDCREERQGGGQRGAGRSWGPTCGGSHVEVRTNSTPLYPSVCQGGSPACI